MGANLDELEGLVDRAAGRLGELAEENRKLASTVRSLREQLAADDADDEAGLDWRRERSALLSGLRQALSDLSEAS